MTSDPAAAAALREVRILMVLWQPPTLLIYTMLCVYWAYEDVDSVHRAVFCACTVVLLVWSALSFQYVRLVWKCCHRTNDEDDGEWGIDIPREEVDEVERSSSPINKEFVKCVVTFGLVLSVCYIAVLILALNARDFLSSPWYMTMATATAIMLVSIFAMLGYIVYIESNRSFMAHNCGRGNAPVTRVYVGQCHTVSDFPSMEDGQVYRERKRDDR